MSVLNVQPVKGRLLSEELGARLYGALRERILRDRMASRNCEEEGRKSPEAESESDSHSTTSTLDEVTKKLKEKINLLAYMKKVKRGMLLHQEYIREQELAGQTEPEPNPDPNDVINGSEMPIKRRKRAKSRALTARKGARRVGQSIRRRPTYSPGHSIANRLRRRSLPNKGYFCAKKHTNPMYTIVTSTYSKLNYVLCRCGSSNFLLPQGRHTTEGSYIASFRFSC